MKKRGAIALFFIAMHGVSLAAMGQTSEAERIFEEARQEYERGDLDAACPHLEKSFNMDGNGGALLSLARCLHDAGKTASAMTRYEQFLKMIPTLDDKRREKAEILRPDVLKELDSLRDRVPRLALQLPPNAPTNLVIWLGGVQVPASTVGDVRFLDPGEYTLAADVPGRKREEWVVLLKAGDRLEEPIRIPEAPSSAPAMRPESVLPQSTKPPTLAATSVQVKPQPISTRPPRQAQWNGRSGAMIASGTFAGLGFLTWAVTGAIGLSYKPTVNMHCTNKVCDNPEWSLKAREMQRQLDYATAGLAVGVLGLTGLAVFAAIGGKAKSTKPLIEAGVWHIDSTGAMFGMKGAF